jgi:hypothetical protein
MIVQETYMIGDHQFIRTYSDANRYVVRDGIEYGEANDPAEFGRTYTEGNLMTDEEIESNAREILDIIFGGDE